MQKHTSLYIPKPCHEDWNKMTPTQQGKFCGSCSKQVIDFSLMSDKQILNFLSQQSGKLCGRFDGEQLQRPLIETKIKKKKSWWMAMAMPLLFLFEKSYSQGSPAITVVDTTISPTEKQPEIMGKLIYNPVKQTTITGKVVDEKNTPLAYASIIQKGTRHGTVTDSSGNFSIEIDVEDSVVIVASYVGYETIEKQIQLEKNNTANVTLKMPEYTTRGLVEIVSFTGAISSYRPLKPIDTIKATIKKICNTAAFKIFPNPAVKGNEIHIEIKQPGEYKMQLLDNQSRLIQTEEINTALEKATTPIRLPSNIAAGIYYLRLIDEQTKKSYTEKLIIQ